MPDRPVPRTEVQRATEGVLQGVELLVTALRSGEASDVDFARDVISRSAEEYEGRSTKAARFGFDELATSETGRAEREAAAVDVLESALLDVEVANALILSGAAAGEAGERGGSTGRVGGVELEAVAEELRGLTRALAPGAAGMGTRFGFDEVPSALEVRSQDLAAAKTGFEERAAAVLDTLVRESKGVIEDAFAGLRVLDPKQVEAALGALGATRVPTMKNLIGKGLALAAAALQKLERLLGAENAGALRALVGNILEQIRSGRNLLEEFLKSSYGVADARERVRELIAGTGAELVRVDEGSRHLDLLRTRFAEQMVLLRRLVRGLGVGWKIAALVVPGPGVALVSGGLYLLAMGYAVMAGLDFADRTSVLRLVDGVIGVAESALR